uniref:Uncharacterized protein n=1 Tax=Romanomermis culicivorax TaxID=13658 RepID=A0A915J7A4_ROMCU
QALHRGITVFLHDDTAKSGVKDFKGLKRLSKKLKQIIDDSSDGAKFDFPDSSIQGESQGNICLLCRRSTSATTPNFPATRPYSEVKSPTVAECRRCLGFNWRQCATIGDS